MRDKVAKKRTLGVFHNLSFGYANFFDSNMKTTAVALKFTSLLLLLGTVVACKKIDINFGENTITDPNIAFIDTISYQLSTIQVDSFITSQTNALLIGQHTDAELGTTKADTYFHIATPGVGSIPDGAMYDSTRLLIVPSGSYYGDTTAPVTMQAFLLSEQLTLEGNTYFYNTHSFTTELSYIGALTTIIRPSVKDTISIPISNTLGANLYRMIRVSSDTLTDNNHFFQYVKGIAIKGTSSNKAVYSFNNTDATVMLRIYYHYTNPFPQTDYVTSKYVADNLQFNHMEWNRAATALAAFTPNTRQILSSTATGNKAFIQNAGGLQLRIDLPYIRSFRTEDTYRKILKAEMYVRPYAYTTSSVYPLPAIITLYTATADNIPGSAVLDKTAGSSQAISPTIDYLYGKDTYYKFDISNYVTDVIDGTTDTYDGLFLQTPAYSTNDAIDRLILANSSLYKSIEIRIYRLAL
jgi:hypothetical protein